MRIDGASRYGQGQQQHPFVLSLSKDCFSLREAVGQGFDKLSPNGSR
jgi:hypothetical protein